MRDARFVPSPEVEADLNRLDDLLRRLRTEYEMFLAGSRRWPPNQVRAEIDAIVRHYIKHTPRRTADRFRFNTLVHRYQTTRERYRRRVSAAESGRTNARFRDEELDLSRPQVLMRTRVSRGADRGDQMRDLFRAYRQARKARGLSVSGIRYAEFAQRVERTVAQAAEKSGGREVELRLDTAGGKVRIAVRPLGSRGAGGSDQETGR